MLKCPACGEATISQWRKFLLSPAIPVVCGHCHAEITLPAYDLGVLLLIVALSRLLPLLYALVAFVVYGVVRQCFVPLVVRTPGKR
jgi:hypothetical protein